jgi:hypothetical protein
MQRQARPVVVAQEHAHVHPPERVRLDQHPSGTERFGNVLTLPGVAAPHDDAGALDRPVRVAEEHHVQTSLPQRPGGHSGESRTVGTVQHFDDDPMLPRRDGVGVPLDLLTAGGQEQCQQGQQGDADSGDQREADDPATRLFQKRTVGSGRGQPDWMR